MPVIASAAMSMPGATAARLAPAQQPGHGWPVFEGAPVCEPVTGGLDESSVAMPDAVDLAALDVALAQMLAVLTGSVSGDAPATAVANAESAALSSFETAAYARTAGIAARPATFVPVDLGLAGTAFAGQEGAPGATAPGGVPELQDGTTPRVLAANDRLACDARLLDAGTKHDALARLPVAMSDAGHRPVAGHDVERSPVPAAAADTIPAREAVRAMEPASGSVPISSTVPTGDAATPLRTAAPVSVSAPRLDASDKPLMAALGERISMQAHQGVQLATIRLDPHRAGTVLIALRQEAGAVSVHLSATHADVVRQLQTISEGLRQDLAGRQFGDVNVQVSAHRPGQQDGGHAQRDGREPERDARPGHGLAQARGDGGTFEMA
jgi:flagellar hook-length control protein FliK